MGIVVELKKKPVISPIFNHVNNGSVFYYNNKAYMKGPSLGGINAICLEDGHLYSFGNDIPVTFVKSATLTIEE